MKPSKRNRNFHTRMIRFMALDSIKTSRNMISKVLFL